MPPSPGVVLESWETRSTRRIHAFRPERVLLQADGPAQQRLGSSWRVDDVLVNGRSQFGAHGRLPAELFSNLIAGAGVCVFDRAADPVQVEVCVTRLAGEGQDTLIGAVLGSATYEPRAVRLQSEARVRAGEVARVRRVCDRPVELYRLVILKDPENWVVSDVRIEDVSQFSQPGDIPGDLFAGSAIDSLVQFGTVADGECVEVVAAYVGCDPEGQVFSAEFRGQEPEIRLVPLHSGDPILRGRAVEISHVVGGSIRGCQLLIEGASDWLVYDVQADGASLLEQGGDLPGALFSEGVVADRAALAPIAAGSLVRVTVAYVGDDAEGRAFSAQIRGLAPRSPAWHDH